MTFTEFAILGALSAGSLRALLLWRAGPRVAVVNTVVLTTLGEGRSSDIPGLLAATGRTPYHRVASELGQLAVRLAGHGGAGVEPASLREMLHHEAARALSRAHRELNRSGWLDGVAFAAIVTAGLGAAVYGTDSAKLVLAMLAATLLWFANVLTARSTARSMYAGAMALADSLWEALMEETSEG